MKYSKIEYLSDLASENNAIAIAVTESHLNEGDQDCEVAIKGWSHIRGDRKDKSGGGVIVYVKENYTISSDMSFLILYVSLYVYT